MAWDALLKCAQSFHKDFSEGFSESPLPGLLLLIVHVGTSTISGWGTAPITVRAHGIVLELDRHGQHGHARGPCRL